MALPMSPGPQVCLEDLALRDLFSLELFSEKFGA